MYRSLAGLLALSLAMLSARAEAELVAMPDYSDADIAYVGDGELDKLGEAAPFIAKYVAALRARSLEAHRPLLHPSSQACLNDGNADFYKSILDQDLRMKSPLGETFKVGLLTITKPEGAARETRPPVRLSVAPTHVLVVSYGTDTKGSHLVRFLAKDAGQFTAILPCPDAEMLERFRGKAQ